MLAWTGSTPYADTKRELTSSERSGIGLPGPEPTAAAIGVLVARLHDLATIHEAATIGACDLHQQRLRPDAV